MKAFPILALIAILTATPAGAVWSGDPTANLPVADRTSGQTIPKIAATPDGGCYIGWHDPASGNYDVYLQRLDALGNEAWPHNGILVSGHPQNSWLTDWDLICDSSGNAVLTFPDIRAGGDWDIYTYKVAPDAAMLWGADGIALSDDIHFEPTPRVCEADDGDLVFVWSRNPDVGDGRIVMQRLAPDGAPRFAPGGIDIAGEPGESPGFCELAPAGGGAVVVSWIRDMSIYMSPRHLWAGKFAADGSDLWGGPVVVYDVWSLPMGYTPQIQGDGAGGALLLWHRSDGNLYNSFVQHLDASGTELFGTNGMSVSTLGGMHHIAPTLAYDSSSGEIYVFWDERNGAQSQWGIYGQRIDAAGNRLWGNSGLMFLPTDTLYKSTFRALPALGGAKLFWIDEPSGYGSDRVRGFRVNSAGLHVWPGGIIDVATTPSIKSRLPVTQSSAGMVMLTWEDDRTGDPDLYAQNVNDDGSLGTGGTAADPAPAVAMATLAANYPNPFNPATTLSFRLERTATVSLRVYDAQGRLLATLAEGILDEGEHQFRWDGADEEGRPLPSGLYFGRLSVEDHRSSQRMVLLK